jgi:hypothetical protein
MSIITAGWCEEGMEAVCQIRINDNYIVLAPHEAEALRDALIELWDDADD